MLGTPPPPIEWPLLACMAWMAHMAAAGTTGVFESDQREREREAASVCVDKLGANNESSIVKTELGRGRPKSAETEMRSPKK